MSSLAPHVLRLASNEVVRLSAAGDDIGTSAMHDGTGAGAAEAVASLLPPRGSSDRVLLVVADDLVVSRCLELPQVAGRHRSGAVDLAFEPYMATPLEEAHVAWMSIGDNASTTVVAFGIGRVWMEDLLAALTIRHLECERLLPETAVWLAWLDTVADGEAMLAIAPAGRGGLVVGRRPQTRVIWAWAKDGGDLEIVLRQVFLTLGGSAPPVVLADTERCPQTTEALVALPHVEYRQQSMNLLEAVETAVSHGNTMADFRSGLFRSGRTVRVVTVHGTILGALVAVGLILWSIGNLREGLHLAENTEQLRAAQALLWHELYPQQDVPSDVSRHLASEHRRLETIALAKGQPKQHVPALDRLREIVAAVPANVRVDVGQIAVDQQGVTLHGETEDHLAAEALSRSIDQSKHLSCPLPRSEVLTPHRTAFVIQAVYREAASAKETSR